MDVIGWLARVWNGMFVTALEVAFWTISQDHKKSLYYYRNEIGISKTDIKMTNDIEGN